MSHLLKTHKVTLLVASLILIGAFLRFYNLNWGAPYYFHPDERNVIYLILKSSLTNPETLVHGTFAYGNFPVILTLLLKPILQPFYQFFTISDPFAQTAITLRIISAFFSVLMLYIMYLTGRFWSERAAILALFLSVFSVGFIQQAHFGTFDGFIAFCAVTIFYFLLKFIKTKRTLFFYLSILMIAIGTASKVNLLVLAVFPFSALAINNIGKKTPWLFIAKHALLGGVTLAALIILFSPNYLSKDFFTALMYERGLVAGSIPVFYTQSFSGTMPIIFQFLHILPFLLNPLLTILLIPALFYLLLQTVKSKNVSFLLLATFFLILFLPQAFLLAKWTRYMVPPLPFMYLILAIALSGLIERFKKVLIIKYLAVGIFVVTSILFSMSYFITAFAHPDTRVEAAKFAKVNIPQNAGILTEPYDIGITAFAQRFNASEFNFYELDNNSPEFNEAALSEASQSAEYMILPSQRLLRARLLNKERFPKGHRFYSDLTSGRSGFTKIYETPCDILCKITYLGDPVFQFEETATVFDHPTVFIFKKQP